MEYRPLGSSGVQVSAVSLGTMMFGPWGTADAQECQAMVDLAVEAGVNLVDTADAYGQGESERIVGRALRHHPHVLVATKVNAPMGAAVGRAGQSRRWIVRACEESLRRLGRDHIDLYQLHRPDPATPLDESLAALDDLVTAGKVRLVGASNSPAARIVEGQWIARSRRLAALRTEQVPYSIFDRAVEAAVLPTCERHGVGVLVWSPLNGGWLTGRHRWHAPGHRSHRTEAAARHLDRSLPENRRKLDLVEELIGLAAQAGCALIELAQAFVLHHRGVSTAIVGPRTVEHLRSQLGDPGLRLGADLLDAIDALVAPGTRVSPDWQTPDHYQPSVARRRRRHGPGAASRPGP